MRGRFSSAAEKIGSTNKHLETEAAFVSQADFVPPLESGILWILDASPGKVNWILIDQS